MKRILKINLDIFLIICKKSKLSFVITFIDNTEWLILGLLKQSIHLENNLDKPTSCGILLCV